MTHYQRLKVMPDAPPEVIRAAYRALASKLHPDRHGQGCSVGDAAHDEMVALNAAYEVLIDPAQRLAYDNSLADAERRTHEAKPSRRAYVNAAAHDERTAFAGGDGGGKVDMDWLTPLGEEERPSWPPSPKVLISVSLLVGMVVTVFGLWIWQVQVQTQMDRALSDQYAARAPVLAAAASALHLAGTAKASAPMPTPAQTKVPVGRLPSVEELAQLSDEELVRVLPTLDLPTQREVVRQREENHLLDGRPMRLRTDRELVDPLAPEAIASTPSN